MTIQGATMQSLEQRHISLDAMRGFAVMGILAMNIIGFAMPEWAYVTPAAYGTDTLADKMAWAFSFVFIDGKMRGLFSLLFGASMMLIIDRAEAKGESAAQVHYRRMAWLALFGLAHYFFIWFGDILFLYAIIGMIAFRFRHWSPERLIKVALIYFCGWAGARGVCNLAGFNSFNISQPSPMRTQIWPASFAH